MVNTLMQTLVNARTRGLQIAPVCPTSVRSKGSTHDHGSLSCQRSSEPPIWSTSKNCSMPTNLRCDERGDLFHSAFWRSKNRSWRLQATYSSQYWADCR